VLHNLKSFQLNINSYTFRFNGGKITVEAYNEEEAKILAQAKAIEKGWSYEILPDTMTLEEVKELVNKQVNEIFRECQDINDCSGDIEPHDALKLAHIQNELAELLHKIYSNN
jgi:nicotinate-nucleotide pyrophosphorylase